MGLFLIVKYSQLVYIEEHCRIELNSNSGDYICQVDNADGKAANVPTDSLDQVVYTLTVAYPPRVTVSPTEEIVVKEGEGTKISCTSDAKPAGDFAWSKNGAKIDGANTSELSLDQVKIRLSDSFIFE